MLGIGDNEIDGGSRMIMVRLWSRLGLAQRMRGIRNRGSSSVEETQGKSIERAQLIEQQVLFNLVWASIGDEETVDGERQIVEMQRELIFNIVESIHTAIYNSKTIK